MNKISIFGVDIVNITMDAAISLISKLSVSKGKSKIFFVNTDCLNQAASNPQYFSALRQGDYVFGDGTGVRWASKWQKTPIVDNVNGTDMLPLLCTLCQNKDLKLFLLGGAAGVAETMKAELQKVYPRLNVVGTKDGFFNHETESLDVVREINEKSPHILLVAFGAPRQELWIDRYFSDLEVPVIIGVGGLFDFFSGRIPRAPLWVRKIGMEWIFRLIQEPRRLARRYLIGNLVFLWRMIFSR